MLVWSASVEVEMISLDSMIAVSRMTGMVSTKQEIIISVLVIVKETMAHREMINTPGKTISLVMRTHLVAIIKITVSNIVISNHLVMFIKDVVTIIPVKITSSVINTFHATNMFSA